MANNSKPQKNYRHWLNVSQGIIDAPTNVVLGGNNCQNNHWPSSPAVRYRVSNKCVMCQRRASQKFSNGAGRTQPENIEKRWQREAYEADKKLNDELDWFKDI